MKVLFICRANVGRSQMAEAFFADLAPHHEAFSAGTHVEPELEGTPVANTVINSMREIGMTLEGKARNQLTPAMVEAADKVIALNSADELPDYLRRSPKLEVWNVPDMFQMDEQFYRDVRALIREKVLDLVNRLEGKSASF